MTEQSTKVVVLGGGYAGTLAANRLQEHAQVTLVNPRPEFVQRIRLHQLVAGTGTATVEYGTVLGEGVRLVVDGAARIDAAARRVELASGDTLDYDYLVYAVGSTTAPPQGAFGVAEFEQAQRLRARLEELPAAAVTVVGGGLTGIETAAELAERGRTVTLVAGGTLAPSLSERGRRQIATTLGRLGVRILETAVVAQVRPDAVVLGDGTELPGAVTVWTAGFGVPELAARSGLRTDELGRLLTDETLTSLDDDRIVAAGDAAAPAGAPLRMSCQAALPLGTHAADTVLSRISGAEPAPVDVTFVSSCVSLGRRAGTVQLAHKDDSPTGVAVGGRLAASIKEMICRGTVWALRREARKPGAASRPKGGVRPVPEVAL